MKNSQNRKSTTPSTLKSKRGIKTRLTREVLNSKDGKKLVEVATKLAIKLHRDALKELERY